MNTADQRREAEVWLRKSSGCRSYQHAAKCPNCGTKNFKRRKDNICYGCVRKGYKA